MPGMRRQIASRIAHLSHPLRRWKDTSEVSFPQVKSGDHGRARFLWPTRRDVDASGDRSRGRPCNWRAGKTVDGVALPERWYQMPAIIADIKIFLTIGSVIFVAGCTYPADIDRAYDQRLLQAHFKRLSAEEFLAQSWARKIEPNTLQPITLNGGQSYVFYDTHACHCAFVGSSENYFQIHDFVREEKAKTEPSMVYVQ